MKRILLIFASLAIVSCGCNKPAQEGSDPKEQNEQKEQTPSDNPSEENPAVAAGSVVVKPVQLNLTVGKKETVTATVYPPNTTDKTVVWASSNPSVALVRDGVVITLAEGTASITATCGTAVGTCEVKVDPLPAAEAPKGYGALPTQGQVAWQRQELLMFYHYGQATFSGWDGENDYCNGEPWSEELLLRNYKPTTIDTDQWVKTAADNGFREIIITAKHHDGFCLWDNPESTADVANEDCSNHTDVLAGLRAACNKYDVNMGIYLSPWDKMIAAAGVSTDVYETRFKNAAKDLMTRYAPVVEFWLDGNHAGDFNWSSVNKTILDQNPQCVIFSNGGPGCRWVGNENGDAAETNWATLNIKGRGLSPSYLPGNYEQYLMGGDEDGDSWCAAECDFSIQQILDHNGWFYGAHDSRKTAGDLMDLYYKSVGRNGVFLMNVPPSDKGVIDAKEVKIIEDFTAMRSAVFAQNLADGALVTADKIRGKGFEPANLLDGNPETCFSTPDADKSVEIEFTLDGDKTFNRVMLQEYIPLGQRVKAFSVQILKDGKWTTWKSGTTIGHKRILLGSTVTTGAVKVKITSSKACPVLNNFGLYNDTVSGL